MGGKETIKCGVSNIVNLQNKPIPEQHRVVLHGDVLVYGHYTVIVDILCCHNAISSKKKRDGMTNFN